MERVTLREKQEWISMMNKMVWQSNTLDASTKQNIDKEILEIVGRNITKQELQQKEQVITAKVKNAKKETVKEVAKDLKNPQNIANISNINSINTITRNGGQVITSIQKNDGSISVKDSSYSGNIEQVVEEVANKNKGKEYTKASLTDEAFKEMERRQIVVNMQDINKAGLNEKQINNIQEIPNIGDNLKINKEYGVLVDGNNKLVDIKNKDNEADNYENSDSKQNTYEEKPKVKTLTRKITSINDAAFVDAALLGTITFYAGVLGLCAILGKM